MNVQPATTIRAARASRRAAPHEQVHSPADEVYLVTPSRSTNEFSEFFATHQVKIARALSLTLGDPELAADATNEAMTRALQRWNKIGTYDRPEAWVYKVGLNWARSFLRRRKRERDRPVQFGPAQAEMTLRDESLDQAIAGLSVDHRAVVTCRFFLDWTTQQTADALGISPGTVKSRLARALDNLRSEIVPAEITLGNDTIEEERIQ